MIHICNRRDTRWKRLPPACLIATHYPKPDGLPASRWVQNISPSWYSDGAEMARAIAAGLRAGDRRMVMIDELKVATVAKIADCAYGLWVEHPDLRGKWGAYLVNGSAVSYHRLQPAIDNLLRAGAVIAPEMYLKASQHPTNRTIKREMRGTLRRRRVAWLVARRKKMRSTSPIIGLVGITNRYLDTPQREAFLRRVTSVWRGMTGGTMGAWVWDERASGVSPSWSIWSRR